MFPSISRTWIWALAAVLLLTSVGDATAKRRKRRSKKEGTVVDISGARSRLAGADAAAAVAAARKLGLAAGDQRAAAAAALAAALAVGVEPDVAIAALKSLAKLEQRRALVVIRSYGKHRQGRVRAETLRVLAALDLQGSNKKIVAGLSDRDPDVRTAAAILIAEHDLRQGVDALVALLRRGEELAVPALGQLADKKSAAAVSKLVGAAPDALVSRALGAMLLNPKFGPDDLRLEVVKTLGAVPGNESIEALSSYVASIPAKPPRASRKEAELIVEKRLTEGSN